MQIKQAACLERLAQLLIHFTGCFRNSRKKTHRSAMAQQNAKTCRNTKRCQGVRPARRVHTYSYGVQNEPCVCKTPVRKTTAEL